MTRLSLLLPLFFLLTACTPVYADPAPYPINIQANGDYTLIIQPCSGSKTDPTPLNLNGYSYKVQFKQTPGGPALLTLTPTVISAPSPLTGQALSLNVTHAQSKALRGYPTLQWDLLQINPGGAQDYILRGQVFISPNITE